MEDNLKQDAQAALSIFNDARTKAIGKLVSNNTFTQKNAEKFGVLSLNFIIKKLDKATGSATESEDTVKDLQKKVDDLKEKLQKAEEKLAAAQGQPTSDESLTQIIDLANGIDVSGNALSDDDLKAVKELHEKLNKK